MPFAPQNPLPAAPDRLRAYQRVTLIGMVLDVLLGIGKIAVGLLGHSAALVADGVHSLSDAVTDVFILIIARISLSGPDSNHPYGHARFETLGTVALGGTLVAVAIILAYSNVQTFLREGAAGIPTWPTLAVALLSVVSKEWIYRYTRRVGEQLRSNMLIANAWHSRTDAFSSIVVLFGIGGAMLGIGWLDALAAVIVALIIAKIGIDLVWDSLRELVDTGLEAEQTDAIRATARTIEGVKDVHAVRTRRMGPDVLLDLHIRVSPSISVSEGHTIGEWVARELLLRHQFLKDVIYHIDAEDDSGALPTSGQLPPLRSELKQRLGECWQGLLDLDQVHKLTIHYLQDKVHLEIYLPRNLYQDLQQQDVLSEQLTARCATLPWFGSLRVWVSG